jgi:hypothetical protein
MRLDARNGFVGDQMVDSFESLSNEARRSLAHSIENQFCVESGCALFDEGQNEEANTQVQPLKTEGKTTEFNIVLTHSAFRDLESFSQTKSEVTNILASVPSRIDSPSCYSLPRSNAFVLKEKLLRVIFRLDRKQSRVTVMAIANARINPLGKIWRYFAQSKGEDLLRTGELYFRRADLLTADPYECRLPDKVVEGRKEALESMYPGKSSEFVESFELARESSYVCCWTMREHESYLAWKHYCQERNAEGMLEDGGFAVETSQRRMTHLHSKLRASHEVHFRHVGYLDHWEDDIPSHDIGEEVFWKAYWFSDEREIRLAILRPMSWSSSPEWRRPEIPTGERVSVDLATFIDSIVFNPFASATHQESLRNCLKDHRPALFNRVRDSVILRKPPLGKP